MANALFAKGKEHIAKGDVDWLNDDIKLVFIDHDDVTPDPDTDEFLSDISAGIVDTSGNFAGKSCTNGIYDADDIVVSSVTGDQFESVVIFKDTGTPATSILIAFFDVMSGLPCTPDGTNITVTWDNGASKIFAL